MGVEISSSIGSRLLRGICSELLGWSLEEDVEGLSTLLSGAGEEGSVDPRTAQHSTALTEDCSGLCGRLLLGMLLFTTGGVNHSLSCSLCLGISRTPWVNGSNYWHVAR